MPSLALWVAQISLFLSPVGQSSETFSPVRFPAEWEPQQSIWMSWSNYDNLKTLSVKRVQVEMIKALRGQVRVDLLVRNESQKREAVRLLGGLKGRGSQGVRFHFSPNQEIWMRDFGPIFVQRYGVKGGRSLETRSFGFNFWSYFPPTDPMSRAEDGVDTSIPKQLGLLNQPVDLISEDGNREFNGKGSMIAVEAVERNRNPELSLEEIEARLKVAFNLKKVIWLKQGGVEDDLTTEKSLPNGIFSCVTTGGHVDNVARFVDERTIFVPSVSEKEASRSEIARINRQRYRSNLLILKKATDQAGRPFRIVEVPVPEANIRLVQPDEPVYEFLSTMKYGSRGPFPKGKPIRIHSAGSYLNFLVSNRVVLTSRLSKGLTSAISIREAKKKDARVRELLKRAFPGRKIVELDTEAINFGGGGIHCITQQMPAVPR